MSTKIISVFSGLVGLGKDFDTTSFDSQALKSLVTLSLISSKFTSPSITKYAFLGLA